MATVNVVAQDQLVDVFIYTWTPLTLANGNGSPVGYQGSGDRTIQFTGTFGAGGSVNLEGSNDGTNWFVLTDPQGNNITKTAAAQEACEENPLFVRANVTAGDGSTSITAIMTVRRK